LSRRAVAREKVLFATLGEPGQAAGSCPLRSTPIVKPLSLDVGKTTSILERLDGNLAHHQKNLSVRRCMQVLRGFHRGQSSLCVPCKEISFRRPAQGIGVRGQKHQDTEISPATGADLRAAKARLANRTLGRSSPGDDCHCLPATKNNSSRSSVAAFARANSSPPAIADSICSLRLIASSRSSSCI
jgi:hypothetical protein